MEELRLGLYNQQPARRQLCPDTHAARAQRTAQFIACMKKHPLPRSRHVERRYRTSGSDSSRVPIPAAYLNLTGLSCTCSGDVPASGGGTVAWLVSAPLRWALLSISTWVSQ